MPLGQADRKIKQALEGADRGLLRLAGVDNVDAMMTLDDEPTVMIRRDAWSRLGAYERLAAQKRDAERDAERASRLVKCITLFQRAMADQVLADALACWPTPQHLARSYVLPDAILEDVDAVIDRLEALPEDRCPCCGFTYGFRPASCAHCGWGSPPQHVGQQ